MGQTLKNVLFKPSSAFDGINIKSAIILTIAMMIIGSVFSGYASVSTFPESAEYQEMMAQFEEMEGFDEEAGAIAGNVAQTITTMGVILAPFLVMIGWLFKAGILNVVFSLLGAEVRFSHTLAILGLAWVPFLVRDLFRGAWMLSSGNPIIATGSLVDMLDIFVAWNAVLLIIGFAVAYKVSRKKAAAVVVGYWAITALISLGLANLGNMFTPGVM
ncbi:Yip1 family protein [Dethiobacter alkaliphilus]|uniref:Yip1 family protein n=1 Tax=Dethiobacter alkaliphilus TaxID=427926 RepID=UPI002225C148|nr:Yip1 family protein [Dethiobacter alkaliphilus]MCW3490395.1 YIP1 family protein [Dethiobacter alkaliphilus]